LNRDKNKIKKGRLKRKLSSLACPFSVFKPYFKKWDGDLSI